MKKLHKLAPVFPVMLFMLMLGCILALVTLGADLYGSLVKSQQAGEKARASLSYVAASLRNADEAGAVSLAPGPEGDALVLAEPLEATGWETRIYLYEGSLMEEYARAGSALDPAAAQAVGRTERFDVALEGQLVTVETGEGTLQVALHSRTGGEGA